MGSVSALHDGSMLLPLELLLGTIKESSNSYRRRRLALESAYRS